jgi:hypothetical protein
MSDRTPSPRQIAVGLQALRDDAARWANSAAKLQEASQHVASTTLDAAAFSVLGDGMAHAYAALHARVATLLQAATANCAAVASALQESADTYENEESAIVQRLRHY